MEMLRLTVKTWMFGFIILTIAGDISPLFAQSINVEGNCNVITNDYVNNGENNFTINCAKVDEKTHKTISKILQKVSEIYNSSRNRPNLNNSLRSLLKNVDGVAEQVNELAIALRRSEAPDLFLLSKNVKYKDYNDATFKIVNRGGAMKKLKISREQFLLIQLEGGSGCPELYSPEPSFQFITGVSAVTLSYHDPRNTDKIGDDEIIYEEYPLELIGNIHRLRKSMEHDHGIPEKCIKITPIIQLALRFETFSGNQMNWSIAGMVSRSGDKEIEFSFFCCNQSDSVKYVMDNRNKAFSLVEGFAAYPIEFFDKFFVQNVKNNKAGWIFSILPR